jgi:hypothetical protein
MPLVVAAGASLACSFGTTPAALTVPPVGRVDADGAPLATIGDHRPNVNIAPFGMCTTVTNPQVASATSAAQGVLTPQPCVPVTTAPWTPGSTTVSVSGQPALTSTSCCTCAWGGVVTITQPGARSVQAT